ncbi:MAG: hypothetical protein Q7S40_26935 [Opitutaceae bacterium]|nr:hypothetical protein [Opitutaceae bacterium]
MGVRQILLVRGAALAIGCAGAVGGAAAPPARPTGLVASAVSPTRVDLTWTDDSDNESAFVVERQISGSTDWSVAWEQNNASFPSLSDMGLPPNLTERCGGRARINRTSR